MPWKPILWCIPCLAMAQSPSTFTPTGSMTTPRFGHTATLLADGRVLVAGGYTDAWNPLPYPLDGQAVTATAEIYDPSTGAFTPTGSMTTPRAYHSATLLPDGRVLIASGRAAGRSDDNLATAELYDPATGLFTATAGMTTPSAHDVNTATLLPNGRVLITGAPVANAGPSRAEIYDPSIGAFIPAASTPAPSTYPPSFATATLLPSGQVLLASAFSSALYDPATGTFSPTAARNAFCTQAALLANGTVLTAGGNDDPGPNAKAFLYDLSAATFTTIDSMTAPRANLTLTALPDGRALIAGGSTWTGFTLPGGQQAQAMAYTCCLASAEIYDPSTGLFTATAGMTAARAGHTATLLPSGQILIVGGGSGDNRPAVATAEVYTP